MAPLQLARPDGVRLQREAGRRGAGHGHRLAGDPSEHDVSRPRRPYLLAGTVATAYKPYLSLSGTSMAAPVVAGTVALMIQANPKLTPNLVKAIIEYTAQDYHYDALTRGRRLPEQPAARSIWRGSTQPRSPARRTRRSARGASPSSGATTRSQSRRPAAGRERVEEQHGLGRVARRGRREHRVGHAPARWREHRLGHVVARVREHRVGHVDARLRATSSGARALGENIVWGTREGRREHRLGDACATPRTSCGARPAGTTTARTSCGARPCAMPRTSSGARRSSPRTSCGARPWVENIVWGTSDDAQVPVLYNDLNVDDSGSWESLFPPDIAPRARCHRRQPPP